MAARHIALVFAFCRVVAEALKTANNGFGRPAGNAQLQSTRRNEIRHGGKFSHVERVFVAHVNHAGAELDAFGLSGDRGEQRVRGRLLLVEVVHAEERAVQSDVFGAYSKVDCLVQRFCGGGYARAGDLSPVAEGEEAELLLVAAHGLEVADADGFVDLRGARVIRGVHGFFLCGLRPISSTTGLMA